MCRSKDSTGCVSCDHMEDGRSEILRKHKRINKTSSQVILDVTKHKELNKIIFVISSEPSIGVTLHQ